MARMRKCDVLRAATYGGALASSDVVRVSKTRRVVTWRHIWRGSDDARALDALRRLAARAAQDAADATGRAVEVYSARGDLLFQVEPRP